MRRALLAVAYFAAAGITLAFLALPVLAIFFRVPPGQLIAQLSNPVVTDALIVSFKTTLIAQASAPTTRASTRKIIRNRTSSPATTSGQKSPSSPKALADHSPSNSSKNST